MPAGQQRQRRQQNQQRSDYAREHNRGRGRLPKLRPRREQRLDCEYFVERELKAGRGEIEGPAGAPIEASGELRNFELRERRELRRGNCGSLRCARCGPPEGGRTPRETFHL